MPKQKSVGIVSAAEANALFADLSHSPGLLLAVSGGPDSTALLLLAARWRGRRRRGPKLLAVTVDHGLRPESAREARAVARLAKQLGVTHRILLWRGEKPATGLPQAAREARYRLLLAAAKQAGASHVLTAHTLDDQAETVLLRMARGSGISGLGAMQRASPRDGVTLLRPFLAIAKARLVASVRAAGMAFAEDPSNVDPHFTRPRLRALMPLLAREGLEARRLALLAQRLRRADAAIEAAVDQAAAGVSLAWPERGAVMLDAQGFWRLPAEIALRLLGRSIARLGDEGPVELGKLEALIAAADERRETEARLRRTLAGALVTFSVERVVIERAPLRRGADPRRSALLTKPASGKAKPANRG